MIAIRLLLRAPGEGNKGRLALLHSAIGMYISSSIHSTQKTLSLPRFQDRLHALQTASDALAQPLPLNNPRFCPILTTSQKPLDGRYVYFFLLNLVGAP